MTTLASLASRLQTLFGDDAQAAAAETDLIERRRKLTAEALATGLVFAWLQHPNASYVQLQSFVAAAGSTVCPSSLCERFTESLAAFFLVLLKRAMAVVLRPRPAAVPLLERFNGVYLDDATQISLPAQLADLWPGSGGDASPAAVKVSARLELCGGSLDLSLGPGKQPDADSPVYAKPLPKGALRLADLGFFNLQRLADESAADVYYISRVTSQVTVWVGEQAVPIWQFLSRCGQDRLDQWLVVGKERLLCRLVAVRCPPEVAARRRQKLYKRCERRGTTPSQAALLLCDWTVFITNVPEKMLSGQEIWVVYRLRWQVELLFKRWKSLGGLSRSRGYKVYRVLTEVYAKLLGAVLTGWLLMMAGGWWPGRSLHQGVVVVQSWGRTLLRALGSVTRLIEELAELSQELRGIAGVQKRRKKPSAFQTVQNPEHDGMAGSPAPSPETAQPVAQPA
jgi:hypothetical protein